jgi:hypothetical protein
VHHQHQQRKIMSKKAVNQIYDEAYAVYVKETMFSSDPTWLEPVPCMNIKTGEIQMGARQFFKERFINKCKTDSEFSEKWGLKIEERELSLDEELEYMTGKVFSEEALTHQVNTPTRLITVTYNDKIIESYE